MSKDDDSKTTSSGESPPSSIEIQREKSLDKLWDRVTWLLKLEASRADHVLQLANAVTDDRLSRDRQTDALLVVRQKLTDLWDQREDARASYTALQGSIATLHTAIGLEKTVSKAIRRGVRDTARHQLLTAQELQEEGEGKVGAMGHIARVFAKLATTFIKAPARAQVLFLIALALLVFGGWIALALHKGAEAPHWSAPVAPSAPVPPGRPAPVLTP